MKKSTEEKYEIIMKSEWYFYLKKKFEFEASADTHPKINFFYEFSLKSIKNMQFFWRKFTSIFLVFKCTFTALIFFRKFSFIFLLEKIIQKKNTTIFMSSRFKLLSRSAYTVNLAGRERETYTFWCERDRKILSYYPLSLSCIDLGGWAAALKWRRHLISK